MSHRLSLLILTLTLTLTPVLFCPATAQGLQLPDMGDPAQAAVGPDEERRLGMEIMGRLRARGLIMDDVQLNEYLYSLGQRIANQADQGSAPFTFFMVRDVGINAFALPNRLVGINAGLLLATEREDELAGVLAHEIAHVTQQHIVRAIADMKRMALPMAAAMVAGAALAAASKEAGQAAMVSAAAASAQHLISFTRANEQEADRVGMQLLARSGFDARGMTDFFAKLERWSGSDARNQIPEMLRTHPRPESRAADTQDRIQTPAVRHRAPRDRTAYELAKARARVLVTDDHTTLIRNLETTLAKGGYGNEVAERYAYALALRQAGRYAAAQQQVLRLLQNDPDRLAFRLEAAELALAAGDRPGGWQQFEAARQLYPDDFTLAMHYGRALATQGDPHQAMRLLQPQVRRRPQDAALQGYYAQAAQRAGDLTATYATRAETYYLNGELLAAMEQLEQGLRNSSLSPDQEAQLRARLKQIRAEAIAQDLPVPKRDAP